MVLPLHIFPCYGKEVGWKIVLSAGGCLKLIIKQPVLPIVKEVGKNSEISWQMCEIDS